MTQLSGKTALVTGSTSGIGLGIAHSLADQGANIMLNGFGDENKISKILDQLRMKNVQVEYSDANLTKATACEDLVALTEKKFNGLDIIVNNAGVQHTDFIEDFPAEKWDLIIALMLSAPFHIMKAALPSMKKRGWGRIINIASTHGLVASPQKSAYVSAKHGLNGLTKVAGLEAANTGVTCNAICPGWVLTPLVEKQVDKIAKENGIDWGSAKERLLSEKQQQAEFTTPEQIGAFVCFLCSEAAANITGAQLPMDGGWTSR